VKNSIPMNTKRNPNESLIKEIKGSFYLFRKNRLAVVGLFILTFLFFVAIFAYQLAPYPEDAETSHFERRFQPPSLEHLFGTDEAGRDVLSRVIIGTRISLPTAFVVVFISVASGMPLGLIAGMLGGKIDSIIMRIADVWIAIPSIVFALAVSAILGPSLINSAIAIAFCAWPWHARFIRAEVWHIKEESYIEAAESIGASKWYIATREVLPNAFIPYIVKITTDLGYAILLLATLGFLGLGAQPPTPEWGTIAGEGRMHLPDIWWVSIFPGVVIFLAVLAFNVVGDGLRNVIGVEEM